MQEYIKLDSFLKWRSVVGTGGEAKVRIAEGEVLVNGEVELRRGRKLRQGDRVQLGEFDEHVDLG
jgi:ribosome-associated protein